MIKPWYKQVWPWVLIAIPILTTLKAVQAVYVMNKASPDLVIDDYYTEGKAINMNLAKYREAASRNLQGEILVAANKAIVNFVPNKILTDTLVLEFVHSTFKAKDFTVTAHRSGEAMFVAELPVTLEGKWHLVIHDEQQDWKMRAQIQAPHPTAIKLGY